MLEDNLEKTFSRDPFKQMGGYIKRCLGVTVYFKVENPAGHRIQKLFVGDEEMMPDQYYLAVYVTLQGVPAQYGRNRVNSPEKSVESMKAYLTKHRPLYSELRGTFIAV